MYYIYTGTSNHWTGKMDWSSGMGNGMDNGCTAGGTIAHCVLGFRFRSSISRVSLEDIRFLKGGLCPNRNSC